MALTTRDTPCPDCDGKRRTGYVAVRPRIAGTQIIEAHRYSVCLPCLRVQQAQVEYDEARTATEKKKARTALDKARAEADG